MCARFCAETPPTFFFISDLRIIVSCASKLAWKFERRNPRPDDVSVKILYSGACHSDIHALKDGWGQEIPLVPGHEIMGEVTNLGSNVKDFERGDHVLIGTMVDSCRVCQQCKTEMESYCRESPTYQYDSLDRVDGTRTRGGYSDTYVADKRFVYHLPKGMNGAAAAPWSAPALLPTLLSATGTLAQDTLWP
jgi:alcohol dehydrogenase (NADP+)